MTKMFKRFVSVCLPLVLVAALLFTCAVCASAEDKPENFTNLTVGDNLVSHYYIDTAYYKAQGCDSMRYTYNGTSDKEEYTPVSKTVDLWETGNQYEIVANQAAAQIAEPTEITIYRDGMVFDTISFSTYAYCKEVIEMDDQTIIHYTGRPIKLQTLCKSIITYAKAAQSYFTDYMAKSGTVRIEEDYSDELQIDSATYLPSIVREDGANVRFSGAAFICTSSAGLRFYLQSGSGTYGEPTISGPDGIFAKKHIAGGKVDYIDVRGILPVYFGDKITVTYGGASITMGVLDYAGTVIQNTPSAPTVTQEALKELSQSLIIHEESTEEYFTGHNVVAVAAKEPTCTEAGNIAYYRCTDDGCGQFTSDAEGKNEITAQSVVIPALGHNYTSVVTDPTCTADGYTTYTCTRCSDSYTDNIVPAIGHTEVADAAVAATCTAAGKTAGSHCSVCGTVLMAQTATDALGHDYTVQTVSNAAKKADATCTVAATYYYSCSRCGAVENNASHTFTNGNALGHSEGAWTVKTGATLSASGTEVKTCSRCNQETSSRTVQAFSFKLPNTDSYLYRVGNANTVTLGTFFDNASGANITGISVTSTKNTGSATCTYTANASDWRDGTLKFANTGVMTITFKHGTATVKTFKLEVVAGSNLASGNFAGATSNNVILLGNVNVTETKTINNGKILYGNGFTMTDTRNNTSGTNGCINMNGGGTMDNVVFMGKVYSSAVTSGISSSEYSPGVWVTGNANIYNSYISECKNALEIKEGTVVLENTTVAGGAISNIQIGNANVTMKNCTTSVSQRGGLKGLGILAGNKSAKINIEGTFTQHNWVKKSDLDYTYQTILSSVYNDSTYAYSNSGTAYVNMGILFYIPSENITSSDAQACINDASGNDYAYIEKTANSQKATVYTAKATAGASTFTAPAYSPTTKGQHPILPSITFDYTTKNYEAKTTGKNTYCYYDSGTGKVLISFETGTPKQWDTAILTVSKGGNSISSTAAMNSTDYTNKKITFSSEGDYNVVYTFTDPYNYAADGSAYNVVYTRTVKINVVEITPETVIYNASFTYNGAAGNYSAKQEVINNNTYVMPDVSATSSTIGSTTVGGKTVYYPIVTVGPTTSNGNTAWSSGKAYYFAPVFSELNITDYNQSTGAAQYTYTKSSANWPHGKSSSNGPDSAVFGYASGAAFANQPYARSMKTEYYGYGKNNNGLCYTSKEIEKDNTASTHLVQYHYVSNDGTTYYYYISYAFQERITQSSGGGECITAGTLITLADGTKKPVESLSGDELLLVWNLETGTYDAAPIMFIDSDPAKDYTVMHACFSDGTDVGIVAEHGFFDLDIGQYVYIDQETMNNYIGHHFVKQADIDENEWDVVILEEVYAQTENIKVYSPTTAVHLGYYTNGVLSMPGGIAGMFNIFDVNTETMTYDAVKMAADIEQYGLFTYDDFEGIIPENAYYAFNGAWLKVAIAKGNITWDYIEYLAERYSVFF